MVVVNPEQIIFFDDLFELGREVFIDPEVATKIPARELREIKPVVQDWPQHPIGETVVVFLKVVAREVGDDIFDVLVGDGSRFPLPGGDLAAPTQPDATVLLQCWPQRHLKPARAFRAIARWNRNSV